MPCQTNDILQQQEGKEEEHKRMGQDGVIDEGGGRKEGRVEKKMHKFNHQIEI